MMATANILSDAAEPAPVPKTDWAQQRRIAAQGIEDMRARYGPDWFKCLVAEEAAKEEAKEAAKAAAKAAAKEAAKAAAKAKAATQPPVSPCCGTQTPTRAKSEFATVADLVGTFAECAASLEV